MLPIILDFGTLDIFGARIPLHVYGYGLMLVLGFLTSMLIAQWRARRAGESGELVGRCGLLALASGVVGARIAYVIQPGVWAQYADAANPIAAILNITSGGLVYYGGVVLATICVLSYLRLKRLPIRRYLDIIAPSLMIGLAFGRAGCLLNGCCFGGPCSEHWAMGQRFAAFSKPLVKFNGEENPFSESTTGPSPLFAHQLETGRVTVDERLVNHYLSRSVIRSGKWVHQKVLHPPRHLHGKLQRDQLAVLLGLPDEAMEKFRSLAGADWRIDRDEWRKGLGERDGFLRGSEFWDEAMYFDASGDGQISFEEAWNYLAGPSGATTPTRSDSRRVRLIGKFDANGDGQLTGAERTEANEYLQADLFAIASAARSAPARPAQALGIANALLIAGVMMLFFRLRRREGQVFVLMLILYPITRFCLESIRGDNPHNVFSGILTHNQYTSAGILAAGVILWIFLNRLPASAGPVLAQRRAQAGASHTSRKKG